MLCRENINALWEGVKLGDPKGKTWGGGEL